MSLENDRPFTTCEALLDAVRDRLKASLHATSLGAAHPEITDLVGNGKMLRSRLAYHLGHATGASPGRMLRAAAAIELIHGASLLHDDVIDGASLRRGASAFWVAAGTSGAILLGDLFYCRAILVAGDAGDHALARLLVEKAGEMCDAESRQELLYRGTEPTWDRCLEIARDKTGSLFAFVAAACGGPDAACVAACEASGYDVGTAYQLADDLLDASGDTALSGKTLGTDAGRDKITAVTAMADAPQGDPAAEVWGLLDRSLERLAPWPRVRDCWAALIDSELRPAMARFAHAFAAGRGADNP